MRGERVCKTRAVDYFRIQQRKVIMKVPKFLLQNKTCRQQATGSSMRNSQRNRRSDASKQKQNQNDDDNQPESTAAIVTRPVEVAAADAAETAEQRNNQNNQNDCADGHVELLSPVNQRPNSALCVWFRFRNTSWEPASRWSPLDEGTPSNSGPASGQRLPCLNSPGSLKQAQLAHNTGVTFNFEHDLLFQWNQKAGFRL
jgi:hypothetical protein